MRDDASTVQGCDIMNNLLNMHELAELVKLMLNPTVVNWIDEGACHDSFGVYWRGGECHIGQARYFTLDSRAEFPARRHECRRD